METWYAIHDEDGRLVSVATVVADPLPKHLTAVRLDEPPRDDQMWDEMARAYVERPAKVLVDRVEDLKAMPDMQAVYDKLSAEEQAALVDAMDKLLGEARYRGESQPVEVLPKTDGEL